MVLVVFCSTSISIFLSRYCYTLMCMFVQDRVTSNMPGGVVQAIPRESLKKKGRYDAAAGFRQPRLSALASRIAHDRIGCATSLPSSHEVPLHPPHQCQIHRPHNHPPLFEEGVALLSWTPCHVVCCCDDWCCPWIAG